MIVHVSHSSPSSCLHKKQKKAEKKQNETITMKERRLLLSMCGVRIRSTNCFIPSSSSCSSSFSYFFVILSYFLFDMEITIHFLISKTLWLLHVCTYIFVAFFFFSFCAFLSYSPMLVHSPQSSVPNCSLSKSKFYI